MSDKACQTYIDQRIRQVEIYSSKLITELDCSENCLPQIGLRGGMGERGVTGATGAKGEEGAMGETGDIGPRGEEGAIGATGATGVTGETGPTGEPGEMGDPGPDGLDGGPGPVGPPGELVEGLLYFLAEASLPGIDFSEPYFPENYSISQSANLNGSFTSATGIFRNLNSEDRQYLVTVNVHFEFPSNTILSNISIVNADNNTLKAKQTSILISVFTINLSMLISLESGEGIQVMIETNAATNGNVRPTKFNIQELP